MSKQQNKWAQLSASEFGFMSALGWLVSQAPLASAPNLSASTSLVVTSDYSGHHKGSAFEVYTLLITGFAGWTEWEQERLRLRNATGLGRRRMSFKGLGDSMKRSALPDFLAAANLLSGLCVSVIVPTNTRSLFDPAGALDLDRPEFGEFAHYNTKVRERLMRVVHLVSFFSAGLSRPGQDVLWFTDMDDIAANNSRLGELTNIWATVLSHYLQHDLRHVRCGTTGSDDGSLQVEDLASIPDLAAGALAELLTSCQREGVSLTEGVVLSAPQSLSEKSRFIATWLGACETTLDRLIFLVDDAPAGGGLRVRQLGLSSFDSRTLRATRSGWRRPSG